VAALKFGLQQTFAIDDTEGSVQKPPHQNFPKIKIIKPTHKMHVYEIYTHEVYIY